VEQHAEAGDTPADPSPLEMLPSAAHTMHLRFVQVVHQLSSKQDAMEEEIQGLKRDVVKAADEWGKLRVAQ